MFELSAQSGEILLWVLGGLTLTFATFIFAGFLVDILIGLWQFITGGGQ
jgi:hypothetical protein